MCILCHEYIFITTTIIYLSSSQLLQIYNIKQEPKKLVKLISFSYAAATKSFSSTVFKLHNTWTDNVVMIYMQVHSYKYAYTIMYTSIFVIIYVCSHISIAEAFAGSEAISCGGLQSNWLSIASSLTRARLLVTCDSAAKPTTDRGIGLNLARVQVEFALWNNLAMTACVFLTGGKQVFFVSYFYFFFLHKKTRNPLNHRKKISYLLNNDKLYWI